MTPIPRRRRLLTAAAAGAAGALAPWLAGCAADPSPPPRWYALPLLPPADGGGTGPKAAAPVTPAATAVVQLVAVTVPPALERDALLVADGVATVVPLTGHRWAEPLRDAVPRVLRADLARLLGDERIVGVPAPAAVAVARTLRVEILALLADPARRTVDLTARVTLSPASPVAGGSGAAVVRTLALQAPADDAAPAALVLAHRRVLWQLSQAIAGLLRP